MRAHGIDLDGLRGRLTSWNARIDSLIERARQSSDRDPSLEQAIESLRHKRDAVEVQFHLLTQPSPLTREAALHELPLAWRELATSWSSVVHHLERERADERLRFAKR